MPEQHLTGTRFGELDLAPELKRGLAELGFEYCTPIQARTLPLALAGKNVAGQAQTGTGKTAAFLLATMNQLLRYGELPEAPEGPRDPRAIILAPTRELALQIHKDAQSLGRYTGLTLALAYGGTGYESQRQALEAGCDILVGTPGRTIDYFKQRVFGLGKIEVVVLDEADRMFDLGFIADLRYLLRRMPAPGQRLNLLFSATLSQRVHELAYEHMHAPQSVAVEPEQVTADRVEQRLYHVAREEKIPLLLGLLHQIGADGRVMVFINTKRAADRVGGYLLGNGVSAAVLSGDIPQKKRQRLLEDFQSGALKVLVATDVAARGLHIPAVSHVINYDLPQDREDYVHRIGRTARAGASGEAISLACEEYVYSLPEIEDYIGDKIPVAALEEGLLREPEAPVRLDRGRPRQGGKRGDGRGDGRDDGRSGGGRGRSRRPRQSAPPREAAAESPAAEASTPETGPGENPSTQADENRPARRRRRRRRPAGGDTPPPASGT